MTKSGGFGADDALVQIAEMLESVKIFEVPHEHNGIANAGRT